MTRPPNEKKFKPGQEPLANHRHSYPLMRTCSGAALLKALHLPLRAEGGHSKLALGSSALLKGFGRRPLARRLGEPPGAGVRKPRKEETAGRKGAVWWGAAYGDF
jgi:hypothetical protein